MKKSILAIVLVVFLFGCSSEEKTNTEKKTAIEDLTVMDNDKPSDEAIELKADVLLIKSENINEELDDLLNDL